MGVLVTINVKRQPLGPRKAHHVSSKDNAPTTIAPIPYEGRLSQLIVVYRLFNDLTIFFSSFSFGLRSLPCSLVNNNWMEKTFVDSLRCGVFWCCGWECSHWMQIATKLGCFTGVSAVFGEFVREFASLPAHCNCRARNSDL